MGGFERGTGEAHFSCIYLFYSLVSLGLAFGGIEATDEIGFKNKEFIHKKTKQTENESRRKTINEN